MAGAITNGKATKDVELDLDVLIDAIDLSPKPVKLGGHVYRVRRDLTGPEIVQYWELVRAKDDTTALSLLVGEDAVALNTTLEQLPQARMTLAVQKLMEAAGLVSAAGDSGESAAS